MEPEPEPASETGGGTDELIQSLEKAALMAKQLPTTADSSKLVQIYSSLGSAHHHLSLFLSHPKPPPPPPLPENSETEPMQVGDDDVNETGQNFRTSVDRVEKRLRECFIQNKRPKRPLSPAAAEQRRSYHTDGPVLEYDPHRTKLRSLDLISQFHS